MSIEMLLLLLGGAIIAVLAAVAGYFLFRVYRLQREQARKLREQEAAGEKALREHRDYLNKSIQLLATALVNEELSYTEASMRIAKMLEQLGVSNEVEEEFSAFFQLQARTAHIPILMAWKRLSPQEQRVYDKERLGHEMQYGEFVLDAAKRIRGRAF